MPVIHANRSTHDALPGAIRSIPSTPARFELDQAENRRPSPWASPVALVEAARAGDVSAMYAVGIWLKEGVLDAGDVEHEWHTWLSAAAQAGHILAQDAMAVAYNHGHEPVEEDPRAAAELFARGADKGHAPSRYELGMLMQEGRGTPRDLPHARLAFELAAGQGHVGALLRWAKMAHRGEGGERDAAGARRALRAVLDAGEESVAAYAEAMLAIDYMEESLLAADLEWYRIEMQEAKAEAWSLLKLWRSR